MKNADKPAYPCIANETYHTEDLDGEPVKQTHTRRVNGLTKRERLAMAAMQGLLCNSEAIDRIATNWGKKDYQTVGEAVADFSIGYADALLAELENTEEA